LSFTERLITAQAAAAEHAQHQQTIDVHSQSSNPSPLSPHFGPTHVPSPPPAASGVRRHQSLTHGPAGGARQIPSSGLKRSGTLQAQIRHPTVAEDHHSPSPPEAEEEYYDDGQSYEEEAYFRQSPPATQQQFQATSPIGRQSPWNTPGEWRSPGSNSSSSSNVAIDDVQRALSALEIASNTNQMYQANNGNFQSGQSVHPPRFNPNHPPAAQAPGMRNNNDNGINNGGQSNRKLQPLVTDFDGRRTPTSQGNQGPVSASAYVPTIGHRPQQQQQPQQPQRGMSMNAQSTSNDRALTAAGSSSWDQKARLGGRGSNPNLQYMYTQGQQGRPDGAGIPSVPAIPPQYLQQQPGGQGLRPDMTPQGQPGQGQGGNGLQGFVNSPIDVPSLIALKGYNPSNFDTRPSFVSRFFRPSNKV
jgi:YTH domain-containing family protein